MLDLIKQIPRPSARKVDPGILKAVQAMGGTVPPPDSLTPERRAQLEGAKARGNERAASDARIQGKLESRRAEAAQAQGSSIVPSPDTSAIRPAPPATAGQMFSSKIQQTLAGGIAGNFMPPQMRESMHGAGVIETGKESIGAKLAGSAGMALGTAPDIAATMVPGGLAAKATKVAAKVAVEKGLEMFIPGAAAKAAGGFSGLVPTFGAQAAGQHLESTEGREDLTTGQRTGAALWTGGSEVVTERMGIGALVRSLSRGIGIKQAVVGFIDSMGVNIAEEEINLVSQQLGDVVFGLQTKEQAFHNIATHAPATARDAAVMGAIFNAGGVLARATGERLGMEFEGKQPAEVSPEAQAIADQLEFEATGKVTPRPAPLTVTPPASHQDTEPHAGAAATGATPPAGTSGSGNTTAAAAQGAAAGTQAGDPAAAGGTEAVGERPSLDDSANRAEAEARARLAAAQPPQESTDGVLDQGNVPGSVPAKEAQAQAPQGETPAAFSAYRVHERGRDLMLDRVQPAFSRVVGEHVTHAFGSEQLPEDARVRAVGYRRGDGIDALVVEVNGQPRRPDGRLYHITLSMEPGRQAREANDLLSDGRFDPIKPFWIPTEPMVGESRGGLGADEAAEGTAFPVITQARPGAGSEPLRGRLSDDYRQYFDDSDSDVKLVGVNALVSLKDELRDEDVQAGRKADPRQTAMGMMEKSAGGQGAKRGPLLVKANSDGTYTVLDGNATAQAAMAGGLSRVPVKVIDDHGLVKLIGSTKKLKDALNYLRFYTRRNMHAMRRVASAAGVKLERGATYLDALTQIMAGTWGTHLRSAVAQRIKDVAKHNDEFGVRLKAVVESLGPGFTLLRGPVKGTKRALEKAVLDYRGDVSKLTDIIRASIVIERGHPLSSWRTVRKRLGEQFPTIIKDKNRFGHTPYDYLLVVEINGVPAEVQIHVRDVLDAKSKGVHDLYEEWRQISALDELHDASETQRRRKRELQTQMAAIFVDEMRRFTASIHAERSILAPSLTSRLPGNRANEPSASKAQADEKIDSSSVNTGSGSPTSPTSQSPAPAGSTEAGSKSGLASERGTADIVRQEGAPSTEKVPDSHPQRPITPAAQKPRAPGMLRPQGKAATPKVADATPNVAPPKFKTKFPGGMDASPMMAANFLRRRIQVLQGQVKDARHRFDAAYETAINDPGTMQRAEERLQELQEDLGNAQADLAAAERWGDSMQAAEGATRKVASPPAKGITATLSPEKQARLAELEKRMAAKLGTELRAGFDPEMFALGAEMGALYIEAGARSFAQFTKAMLSKFGDAIKPYLKTIYNAARDFPGADAQGMDSYEQVQGFDVDSLQETSDVPQTGGSQGQPDAEPLGQDGDQGAGAPGPGDGQGAEGIGGDQGLRPGEASPDGGTAESPAEPGDAPLGGRRAGVSGRDPGVRRQPGKPRKPSAVEPEPDAPEELNTPAVAGNWIISDPAYLERGGSKLQKAKDNIAAIETAKKVMAEGRRATPEEQAIIAGFRGWGDLPGMFSSFGTGGQHEQLKEQRERLKDILTEEEHAAAASSITNAHYTSPHVVSEMYRAVQRMGIARGAGGKVRILEPAIGIGNYFGLMPGALRDAGLTAVEMDHMSARMAQLLYPDSKVIESPFQQTNLPDNYYDLIISNVPFSKTVRIESDPKYAATKPLLHDYYFLKSLDLTRPGGIVAFITSSGTMDGAAQHIREEINERADFLGAIRLPTEAFVEVAGTEVVTDIIFLQKRPADQAPKHAGEWTKTGFITPPGQEPIRVNEYYLNNPGQVMGVIDRSGKSFAGASKGVTAAENWPQKLVEATDRLPAGIFQERGVKIDLEPRALEATDGALRDGGYVIENGKLARREGPTIVPVKAGKERLARAKGLLGVRDAMRAVINAEIAGTDDAGMKPLRKTLNKLYDAFHKKHGYIRDKVNLDAINADPDVPVLAALEVAIKGKKGEFAKADIFRQRVIRQATPTAKTDDIKGAIGIVLNEKGALDIERVAEITSQSVQDAGHELVDKGLAYESPEGGWQTADVYLSGNVKAKLKQAQAAAKLDRRYQPNVEALEKVIPEDVPVSQIHVKMGGTWIAESDYADFIAESAGVRRDGIQIAHVGTSGKWYISYQGTPAVPQYSTDRASFKEVLESAMSGTPITIKDRVSQEPEIWVINQKDTAAANTAVRALERDFKRWLWGDDARRQRLHRVYNDTMNTTVKGVMDGSHLTFPGMNPAFDLHAHNRDVAWHIIVNGRLLMAHEVGTGKTMGMGAAAMELRRLGLAAKVCIACPKPTALQTANEIRQLYPGVKLLSTAEGRGDAFSAENRKRSVASIATGDWDIVLITHEHLNYLPLSPKAQAKFIEQEIREMRAILEALHKSKAKGGGARATKAIEAALQKKQEQLRKLMTMKRDDAVTFEETGIDFLMVDEAHKYKALTIHTAHQNVKGIPTSHSDRGDNLYMLVRHMYERRGNRGVVLATGTPVTNSMAEVYNMQRLMQHETLDALGVKSFDDWAATFGNITSKMEYTHTGQIKNVSSFSEFGNLQQLQATLLKDTSMFRADDSPTPVKRPKRKDAEVRVKETPQQNMWRRLTLYRVAEMPRRPEPGDDQHILLSSDGALAALDMRLVLPDMADEPGSKLNKIVSNVLERWHKDPDRTQFVFSDIGVHANAWGFSAYDEIIRKLIAGGVPEDRIVDARKFEDSAKGKRYKAEGLAMLKEQGGIAIGSTDKLGTGVNAQDRAIAVHHADAPYWPAALEQRNGRAYRQGNMLYIEGRAVEILFYVTENSADAWRWQLLSRKSKFINDFMAGKGISNHFKEEDAEELTPQQIMAIASGNPELMEMIQLESDVERLAEDQRFAEQSDIEAKANVEKIEASIAQWELHAESQQKESKYLSKLQKAQPEEYTITLNGQAYDERKAAGDAIDKLAKDTFVGNRVIGEYGGLDISQHRWDGFRLVSKPDAPVQVDITFHQKDTGFGTLASMEYHYRAAAAGKDLTNIMEILEENRRKLAPARARAGKTTVFEQAEELDSKQRRLAVLQAKFGTEAEKSGDRGAEAEKLRKQAFEGLNAEQQDRLKSWYRIRVSRIGKSGKPAKPVADSGFYVKRDGAWTPAPRAKPVTMENFADFDWFIAKEKGLGWRVHEATTGRHIVEDFPTQAAAIAATQAKLDEIGADKLREGIASATEVGGPSPYVAAKASRTSVLDKVIDAAQAVEDAAVARLKAPQAPMGRNAGQAPIITWVADVAIVAASRAVKASAKGAKAVNTIIRDTIKEINPAFSKHFNRVRTMVRSILDASENKAGGYDAAEFEKAIDAIKANPKAARVAYYAGLGEGLARMKSKLPKIRLKLAQKFQDKITAADDLRKILMREIKKNLPTSLHGRFLATMKGVHTARDVAKAIGRMHKLLAHYEARADAAKLERIVREKKIRRKYTVAVRKRLREIRAKALAIRQAMLRKGVGPTPSGKPVSLTRVALEALAADMKQLLREAQALVHAEEQTMAIFVAGQKVNAADLRRKVIDRLRNRKAIPANRLAAFVRQAGGARRFFRRQMTPDTIAMIIDADMNGAGPAWGVSVGQFWQGETARAGEMRRFSEDVDALVKAAGFRDLAEARIELGGALGEMSQLFLTSDGRMVNGATARGDALVIRVGGEMLTVDQALDIYAKDPDTQLQETNREYTFDSRPHAEPFLLRPNVRTIIDTALPTDLKILVKKAKRLRDRRFRKRLFQAHRNIKGWEPDPVVDYWPRRINREQMTQQSEAPIWRAVSDRHLEDAGFLKERDEDAKAPMLIGSFLETLMRQADAAAAIIHMAERVRAAEAVLRDPEVKAMIESRFGGAMVERLEEMIRLAAGVEKRPLNLLDRAFIGLVRNISRSKTAINVRTWLRNMTGAITLAVELEAGDLADGMKVALSPELGKRMFENSDFVWMRYQHNPHAIFSMQPDKALIDMGPMKASTALTFDPQEMKALVEATVIELRKGNRLQAVKNLHKLLGDSIRLGMLADSFPLRVAWGALEAKALREMPNATEQERLEWVSWEHEKLIRRTQNTSSVNDTSGLVAFSRNSTWLAPILALTGDSQKKYNIVVQAALSGDRKRQTRVGVTIALAAGASAMITGGFGYGLYELMAAVFGGGDEWERQARIEKALERLAWGYARELAGMVIGGSQLLEFVEAKMTGFAKGERLLSPAASVGMEAIGGAWDLIDAFKRLDPTEEQQAMMDRGQMNTAGELFTRGLEKVTLASLDAAGISVSPTYWLIKGALPKGSDDPRTRAGQLRKAAGVE